MLDMCTALHDNAPMSTNIEALSKAVSLAGSAAALASAAGISPQFLSEILKGERPLPRRRAVLIERHTGVSRQELFPEDWHEHWPELVAPDEVKP
jgi:DNA-binding transcriptional regulator YdaS (Cro superfamily)